MGWRTQSKFRSLSTMPWVLPSTGTLPCSYAPTCSLQVGPHGLPQSGRTHIPGQAGKREWEQPQARIPQSPTVLSQSSSFSSINTFQIVVSLWSISRTLRWLFLPILSNFIISFFEERICQLPHMTIPFKLENIPIANIFFSTEFIQLQLKYLNDFSLLMVLYT